MLEGRLANTLEGVAFALLFLLLFYVVGFLAKRLFNRSIASPRYYVVAVVAGFLLHGSLVTLWSSPASEGGAGISASSMAVAAETTGLDKPFIPPKEADLEKFPLQLKQSIEALNAHDQAQANEAVAFLTFALFADLLEKDPKTIDRLQDSDIAAKSLTKLYRFAQKNGSSMTLRKYIELSEEFKRQKPGWWRQYVESSKER